MISYNDYAKEFLGKDKWNELVKEFNLCTKKWTYGRTKDFYKRVDNLINKKLKEERKKMFDVDKKSRQRILNKG